VMQRFRLAYPGLNAEVGIRMVESLVVHNANVFCVDS
jgi:hypothetical protein